MKQRPILAGFLALLILQSIPAANVAPVLSSVGKLLFPENSVSAYLQASSGALTVAAGGTNKNVILAPSGSGVVSQTSSGNVFTSYSAANSNAAGTGAATQFLGASDWGNVYLMGHNTGRVLTRFGVTIGGWGELATDAGNGLLVGTRTATPLILGTNAAAVMELFSSGGVSAGSAVDPGAGVLNAANGFSSGGTAGASATITVRNSAGTGTCTITYAGGIVTGSTC